jgi:hypothetical protein
MLAAIMMVFEVQVEESGDLSPITDALRTAEIGSVHDTTVDMVYMDQLAKSGLVALRKVESEDSSLQVLAIEASAKRLGKFLAELSRKNSGIVNFRYGMTQNRDLIQSTLAILERGNSSSGEEASVQRINISGENRFQPPKEGQLEMLEQGVPFKSFGDDGPDFLTSVILIVR